VGFITRPQAYVTIWEGKMSHLMRIFAVAMLMVLGNISVSQPGSMVNLNASQVSSARDIEEAIEAATGFGQHAGIVILDGSQGKFIYTGADRSINIYYSNVTLKGIHGAIIGNCDDGIFFDDVIANNLTIDGLGFVCKAGHGIIAPSLAEHHNGIVRDAYIETGENSAIYLLQGDGWTITNSHIQSYGDAIYLDETGDNFIRNSEIIGGTGIVLYNSGYNNRVVNNHIIAWQHGVLLSGKTLGNKVVNNSIERVQVAGITFTDIVAGNKVISNQVACYPDVVCVAVSADPLNYAQNTIIANVLVDPKSEAPSQK
jgi:Right handed beta helix region